MSDAGADPDVSELLSELTRELRALEQEVEPPEGRNWRRDLARFTSEVAIPALILVLKTNIRVLELLRRTIRIAEGRNPQGERSEVRERAERLGQVTLDQLDEVLSQLQGAVEGRDDDERAQQLIEDARSIRERIQTEMDGEPDSEPVDIDVEAELRALKDDLDDTNGSQDGDHGGDDGPEGSQDDPTGDGSDDPTGDGPDERRGDRAE